MSDDTPRPRLLIVEDDDALRGRLARAFRERGFEPREADGVAAAVAQAREGWASHAVVDLRLRDGSGLEVVRALRAARSDVVVVVLTGYGSIATALEAVRLGARHYLTKPSGVDALAAALGGQASEPAPAVAEAQSLARVEWEHINRVLADCGGNVSEAARALGIHRRSLQRKLAKFPSLR